MTTTSRLAATAAADFLEPVCHRPSMHSFIIKYVRVGLQSDRNIAAGGVRKPLPLHRAAAATSSSSLFASWRS